MDSSFSINQPVSNTTVYQDQTGNIHVVVYNDSPTINTGFTAQLFDEQGGSLDVEAMTQVNTTDFWSCDLEGGTPRNEPLGVNNRRLDVTATKASGDPQGPNETVFEYAVRP